MRLVAIETSSAVGGVALLEDTDTVAQHSFERGMRHGKELVPTLKSLFEKVGWDPRNDLDLVAVDVGPGSYTGLRVGVTCAKTLCYITGAQVVGVVSLDALAENAPDDASDVCAVIDAKRREVVYAAFYSRHDGALKRSGEVAAVSPSGLLDRTRAPSLLLGDGVEALGDLLPRDGIDVAPRSLWTVRPSVVGRLGLSKYLSGRRDDPLRLSPVYLRRPEAEEKMLARESSPPKT